MGISSWLSRSVGRTREGTKAHLVGTAELLNCSAEVLHTMRGANDEECEALLIGHISRTCGGTVDWREHPQDIAAMLTGFLGKDDAALLASSPVLGGDTRPPQAVQSFDDQLSGSALGVRALESFGDSYIVLVVSRHLLARFDDINKHWLAQTSV